MSLSCFRPGGFEVLPSLCSPPAAIPSVLLRRVVYAGLVLSLSASVMPCSALQLARAETAIASWDSLCAPQCETNAKPMRNHCETPVRNLPRPGLRVTSGPRRSKTNTDTFPICVFERLAPEVTRRPGRGGFRTGVSHWFRIGFALVSHWRAHSETQLAFATSARASKRP